MRSENKSPLRYPGGKTRGCKVLDEIIKEYFDITLFENIVSPFFGGGSFEFYLQHKYNLRIIANDKFKPLYSFWNSCKTSNNKLCEILYKNIDKITKEDFLDLREKVINEENELQQAVIFFIINRCSFSGCTLSGGFSLESSKKRFTKSSIDRISKLNLSKIEIFNNDFEDFLQKDIEKAILFLDPPYYLEKKSKLYGNNGDLHENFNHEKLFKCLKNKKNWLLTYNNCDFIKNLYKDYKIIETNWTYGMNKNKKSSEIVIIG